MDERQYIENRIRNKCVQGKLEVAQIEDKIENRLRWFGHVQHRLVDARRLGE